MIRLDSSRMTVSVEIGDRDDVPAGRAFLIKPIPVNGRESYLESVPGTQTALDVFRDLLNDRDDEFIWVEFFGTY